MTVFTPTSRTMQPMAKFLSKEPMDIFCKSAREAEAAGSAYNDCILAGWAAVGLAGWHRPTVGKKYTKDSPSGDSGSAGSVHVDGVIGSKKPKKKDATAEEVMEGCTKIDLASIDFSGYEKRGWTDAARAAALASRQAHAHGRLKSPTGRRQGQTRMTDHGHDPKRLSFDEWRATGRDSNDLSRDIPGMHSNEDRNILSGIGGGVRRGRLYGAQGHPTSISQHAQGHWVDEIGGGRYHSLHEAEQHVYNHAMSDDHDSTFRRLGKNDEVKFEFASAEVLKVDESLGLVLGFAIVCKKDGADYYDVQEDHIPEDAMMAAAADFMENSRVAKEMHEGDQQGSVVFAFPLTTDIAKAMGIETKTTGLMIGMKPPANILGKFKSGEYTGFSIGGRRGLDEEVD